MKKLTKEQLQLIEEAKYGFSEGIYDESDLAFYAEKLKLPLSEVKTLVGTSVINESFIKSVGAPAIAEDAVQPAIDSLHEMAHGKMREATKELLKGGKAKCIYEKWVKEGYLTEDTCTEEIAEELMKDDDICSEMYESCMGVAECGESGDSWMKTRAGAQGKIFENEDGELPVPIEDNPDNQELGDTETNPEDVIKLDVPLLIRLLEFSKENAETDIDLHKLAENLVAMTSDNPDRVLCVDDYETILQDLAKLDPEDQTNSNTDTTEEDPFVDNDEPEQLAEGDLPKFEPKKGSSIDNENKKNEEESSETIAKDAEEQSETVDEKVEELRNQKHNESEADLKLTYLMKGKTPADFTLDTEDPQYEARIKKEMETGDSRDRDESVVGPKANIGDEKVFTVTPEGKDVADGENGGKEEYKKFKERKKLDYYSSVPLNTKEKSDIHEQANQKIDRMKTLINFDSTAPSKVAKINEDIDFIEVYNRFKENRKK